MINYVAFISLIPLGINKQFDAAIDIQSLTRITARNMKEKSQLPHIASIFE